jgi:hypothetical protein
MNIEKKKKKLNIPFLFINRVIEIQIKNKTRLWLLYRKDRRYKLEKRKLFFDFMVGLKREREKKNIYIRVSVKHGIRVR